MDFAERFVYDLEILQDIEDLVFSQNHDYLLRKLVQSCVVKHV